MNKIPSDIVVFDSNHKYLFINEVAIQDAEKRTWAIGHNDYEYCDRYGRDTKIADARREVFNRAYNSKQIYEYEESILNRMDPINGCYVECIRLLIIMKR